MIHVRVTNNMAELVKKDSSGQIDWTNVYNCHNWSSYQQVCEHARLLTQSTKDEYIGVDYGDNVSPRYDITMVPKIGEAVSYTFNGDYYPCGVITKISASKRIITTDTNQKFYRYKLTGSWLRDKTWALVPGHIQKWNESF